MSLVRMVFSLSLLAAAIPIGDAMAGKGAQSPYDTIYKVTKDTQLRAAPEIGSVRKVDLAKGTEGVVMRWCRGEFNFRDWAFGSLAQRRAMLAVRVCEVKVNGVIGFIDAKYLDPM